MRNPLFLLLLLGLWIIPACKKNAFPVAAGNTLNKTVMTVSGESPFVDSFVYDGQQRLAEVIYSGNSIGGPSGDDTITLQYDASGRVLSWTQIISGQGTVITYELSYDGNGRVIKALAVPIQADIEFSDYSFAYDAQGQLVTDTIYAQHLAGILSAGIMEYDNWTYDENGNAIADQLFTSSNTDFVGPPFTADEPNTYRYDNRVNPYYHAGIPFFSFLGIGPQLLSPNNLAGGTTTGTSAVSPYTYSYAYYSNGRPREQQSTWSTTGGAVSETTLYFYQ